QVRSLSRGQWMACQFGLIELTVLTLTLASCGGLIRGGETAAAAAAEMILTSLLGVALAWLGAGLMALLCLQMVVVRRRDPARPVRPVLHLVDHTSGVTHREIARLITSRGRKARFAPAPA